MIRLQTFNRLWLLVLCLGAAQLQAADFQKTRNGPLGPFVAASNSQIFINPLGWVYGTPAIGYEQALSPDNSFTAQLGFRTWGGTGYDLNYIGLLGSYRWWVGDHAKLQGVYVGPLATVQLVNAAYDVGYPVRRVYTGSTFVGLGGEGGYQWVLPAHLTLGLGLNAAYYLGTLSLEPGAPSFGVSGIGLGLQGTIGYAF